MTTANKTLPLDGVSTEEIAAATKEAKAVGDQHREEQSKPKRDLLHVMRRIEKALEGFSDEERNIVLTYLQRKR